MLNRLNIFLGLQDDRSNLEATTPEKVAMYCMYGGVTLVTVLLLIMSF